MLQPADPMSQTQNLEAIWYLLLKKGYKMDVTAYADGSFQLGNKRVATAQKALLLVGMLEDRSPKYYTI